SGCRQNVLSAYFDGEPNQDCLSLMAVECDLCETRNAIVARQFLGRKLPCHGPMDRFVGRTNVESPLPQLALLPSSSASFTVKTSPGKQEWELPDFIDDDFFLLSSQERLSQQPEEPELRKAVG